jgi:uncharacterized SAM-binding protein YcdF (DUF218 family)
VNALVAFVFSTTGVITSLLVAAAWLAHRPRSTSARAFLTAAALWYTLAGTYAVPALIARALSIGYHQFTMADKPPEPVALVVLGSGTVLIRGWVDRADVMTDTAAARVLEAARVYRLIDPAVVVSSGGLPSPDDDSQPSGANMRTELVRLGVPESRIIIEIESRNTRDEATIVTPMLRDRGIERMVLVTSDSHMRRALGVFRAYGWNAVPAIAPDPGFSETWPDWLIPSYSGLEFSRQVSREIIGLPYYWARGWWRWGS